MLRRGRFQHRPKDLSFDMPGQQPIEDFFQGLLVNVIDLEAERFVGELAAWPLGGAARAFQVRLFRCRSEEHTSELQSRPHLVCRLLLEKKKTCQATRATPKDTAARSAAPRT